MPPGPDAAAREAWADLLPDADYAHRLKLQRVEPADYFRGWETSDALLRERQRWIQDFPARHCLALSAAAPLLEETLALAASWTALPPARELSPARNSSPLLHQVATLGTHLEPDLVWLRRDGEAARVVAATVCFPSSWSPESKLGLDLRDVHAVVPGLNAAVGAGIATFLDRLRPGIAWRRANWGLSASPERNQHPARGLPRLTADTPPESVWFRVEHQALLALPQSRGVLFGIRIAQTPLPVLRADPTLAGSLARALRSMPETMAEYKALATLRPVLLRYLPGPPGEARSDDGRSAV